MKAIVNEGCIGCGLCASTCPAVFTLEDGVAVAMAGTFPRKSCLRPPRPVTAAR